MRENVWFHGPLPKRLSRALRNAANKSKKTTIK